MFSSIKRQIREILKMRQASDEAGGYVLNGMASFLLLYVFSLSFGFLFNFVLVRVVGVSDYGAYVYIANLVALLSGFCIMGTDVLLIKQNEIYCSRNEHANLKAVIRFSLRLTLLASFFWGILLIFLIKEYKFFYHFGWYEYAALGFLILPFASLTAVLQASLQGLKKIVYSQFVEKIFRPCCFLLLLVLFFFIKIQVSLSTLILISTAVTIAGFCIVMLWNKKVIEKKTTDIKAIFDYRRWLKLSVSFFLLNVLFVLNSRVDIFLLGLFRNQSEVGVYNIVLKLGELSGLGLFGVNFVASPIIAKLVSVENALELQRFVISTARMALLISLPIFLCLIMFSKPLLELFHVYTETARLSLIIICFGQLVNVIVGSVGLLLLMSNNQKYSIISLAISIIVSLALNFTLTPQYGVIGVAIASSVGLIFWNLLMCFFVHKKLHINSTVFGKL